MFALLSRSMAVRVVANKCRECGHTGNASEAAACDACGSADLAYFCEAHEEWAPHAICPSCQRGHPTHAFVPNPATSAEAIRTSRIETPLPTASRPSTPAAGSSGPAPSRGGAFPPIPPRTTTPLTGSTIRPVAATGSKRPMNPLMQLASSIPERWQPDRTGLVGGGLATAAGVVFGQVFSQAIPALSFLGALPFAVIATTLAWLNWKKTPGRAALATGVIGLVLVGLSGSTGEVAVTLTSLGFGYIAGVATLLGATAARGSVSLHSRHVATLGIAIPLFVAALTHLKATQAQLSPVVNQPAQAPPPTPPQGAQSTAPYASSPAPLDSVASTPDTASTSVAVETSAAPFPVESNTAQFDRTDGEGERLRSGLRNAIESTWSVESTTVNSGTVAAYPDAAQDLRRALAMIGEYEQRNGSDTTSLRLRAGSNERLLQVMQRCAAENQGNRKARLAEVPCP